MIEAAAAVTPVSAAALLQDQAGLLAAHAAGLLPSTLLFHRCRPAVVIGRHQVVEREARLAHCLAEGIDVVRRATAGGALYLDPGQQCLSLVVPSARLGKSMAERLHAAARMVIDGLAQLGVAARFKAPNDVELESRQKIASVFLAEEGNSALVFAVVSASLDLKSAMQALLVPTEKLTVTGLEHARERMTSLADCLGADPGEEAVTAALRTAAIAHLGPLAEDPAPPAADTETAAAPWQITGTCFETKDKTAAATLRLALDVDATGIIRFARFATDAHVMPASLWQDLAAELTGIAAGTAAARCRDWLRQGLRDAVGVTPEDVARLMARAVSKLDMQRRLALTPAQASGLMLAGPDMAPEDALRKASVMLVPYCAKPNWCKWRHTIDCVECGECEVGDAYAMARDRNMEVVTITNFEHLSDTLGRMRAEGVESYVGMCCGEFFLKRHHAFRDSGMAAVLLDIEGATCYELKEEHLAYAGAFQAEARLDLDSVAKVMREVPVRDAAGKPCLTGAARRPGERRATPESCAACRCKETARSPSP
jgi:lipoate-protein ligase A